MWQWLSTGTVAQGGCGVSILGYTQKPTGHSARQPVPGGPAWAGKVGPNDLQMSLPASPILRFVAQLDYCCYYCVHLLLLCKQHSRNSFFQHLCCPLTSNATPKAGRISESVRFSWDHELRSSLYHTTVFVLTVSSVMGKGDRIFTVYLYKAKSKNVYKVEPLQKLGYNISNTFHMKQLKKNRHYFLTMHPFLLLQAK